MAKHPRLAAPTSPAARAALDPLRARLDAAMRGGVWDQMKARGALRLPWQGGIFLGPNGPEAVIVVLVIADPNCERLADEERRLTAALEADLQHLGLNIGGVLKTHQNEVWVRGEVVRAAAA